MKDLRSIWMSYRLRLRRKRLLARAMHKRRQLACVIDRTDMISPKDILAMSVVRNERVRLPYFLEYYRKLGINQFLIVDNNSDDGTADYLRQQPDVSLWSTHHSYKMSRFGVDWLTWLQIKYAHGHWCLTVDADELLVYPYFDTQTLGGLTDYLDSRSLTAFGTVMLDMYPKGRLGDFPYQIGQNPISLLNWFDGANFRRTYQPDLQNIWIQGGVRERYFFKDRPERAPTLNKTPLVKWNRRFAYLNSSHSLLPPRMNRVFDSGEKPTGVLLHSKFLHTILEKSQEEKQRQEHFANSALYDNYYDGLIANPVLWCEQSIEYKDWAQLQGLELISAGEWAPKPT